MNNPTFASSVFGGGDPTAPSMQGPAAAYMSNQNATYQSSVFKDPSPQRTRPTSSGGKKLVGPRSGHDIFGQATPSDSQAWFGKGRRTEESCREDYRGYVRDQDRAASELLSSDGHAAPCHRRKPFVSTKYQSNISRLGADELPDVEPRLDRHLVSDGVRGSLRMGASSPPRSSARTIGMPPSQRGPVASSQYPTSYSEDPNSAIYPNASACQHKKRSVAHNKTPYAHSEEFNILKQEVRCFNDGPGQAPGAVAVGGSRAQGSTSSSAYGGGAVADSGGRPIQRSTLLDHSEQGPGLFSADRESTARSGGKKLIPQPVRASPEKNLVHVGHDGSGAEKVPRKNYQVMVHQQPLRGDYARQVIGRYEQVPTAAVDHSQLFN
mmetsp:Transcript_7414/g.17897  ORF Transcript_7414/g.17897 Transcript_7414/m.17897 type:complete len:380 (+) Transcript_7414:164-1303(+)